VLSAVGRLEADPQTQAGDDSTGDLITPSESRRSEADWIPLMHSRRADRKASGSTSKSNREPAEKAGAFDDIKTLKRACSSEYQGAQGAFKDSMIH
jgi:hypothetical protein